jgi:tetratricopeptide (TPR) repeat protein
LEAISRRDWPAAEFILRALADSQQPLVPQVGHHLALVLREQGKVDECAIWLQRVLSTTPGYHAARFELAAYQMDHGDLERALENFRLFIEAVPDDPDGLKNAGLLAMRLGQWREAEDWLDRCLARQPDDVDAQLARANVAREAGDMKRAEAIYRRLFKDEIPLRPLIQKSMTQGGAGHPPLNEDDLTGESDV